MTTGAQRHQIPVRGVMYMLATAVIIFPSLNASVKYLIEDYSLVQIVWVRSIVHFSWMLVLFMPALGLQLFRSNNFGIQISRSFFQLIALVTYVIGLSYIPIGTAAAIYFTGPLIVVALSAPMLAEKVGIRRWVAVFFGFVGALIIIRPGVDGMHWATVFILASAVFYAFFQLLTRIAADHDDYRVSAIYTVALALIISTFAVPFFWKTPVDIVDCFVFAGLGVFGGVGHLFIVKAYEHAEASLIGPLDYGQLLGATIIGYVVFAEFPDLWTWFGAAIIVLSGIYVAQRERAKVRNLINNR